MRESKVSILAASAALLICLLAYTAPGSAYADPLDSTLFCLPHVTGSPGDSHVVALDINTVHDIGGFRCGFTFGDGTLITNGISYDGTRSEGVPIWTGMAENVTSCAMVAVVIYGYSGFVPAGTGPVANLILCSDASIPEGSLLPLSFCRGFDCLPLENANELTDPGGLNVFLPDFSHGSIRFGFDSLSAQLWRGDVNLNGVRYEAADLELMYIQLQEGIGSYIDEDMQTVLSDVNCDHVAWTIADLLTIQDVVEGSVPPPHSDTATQIFHQPEDSIWFTGCSVEPSDTFEIPIYVSNGDPAGAISFKLHYSADELHFVSYSSDGTRLPVEWDLVSAVERNTGLMFYAMPDVYGDYMLPPGDGLFVRLKFVAVNPVSTEVEFRFEKLQSHGQANGYAVNDMLLWRFASLQQIDSDIHFSFLYGDADASGAIDIDDVVHLILYLFDGGPAPEPYDAGDFDRNQVLDLDDIVALIEFVFGQ